MLHPFVKQLAHVCILARDLAATEAFYREVLGIPTRFNFTRQGKWYGFYLDIGGRTNIEVFEAPAASYADTDAITHFCLEVTSLDTAIAHIRAQGGTVTDKKLGVDNTWQAWTADPNQVRIELFEYTTDSAQFTGGDRVANW